ncbi:hypothetical protein JCM10207_009155 [Rhodosporidiobolus poonsookiae]
MSLSSPHQQTVLQHSAVKGIQGFALLSPPLILARALIARRFPSLSSSLRSLTLGTFLVGPAAGGVVELGRLYWQGISDAELEDKSARLKASASQRQADDYAVIGGVLGSLVGTTLFLRRAPLVWVIGGGASLGVAGGVLTHVAKGYAEGEDTVSPVMVKEEVKGAVGAKGR